MSNRKIFLAALRSGKYPKGTTIADDKGRPVIQSEADEGFCAVGLIDTLFNPKYTSQDRLNALNLTQEQVTKIQREYNDSSLTFPQIADLIEWEMFNGDQT